MQQRLWIARKLERIGIGKISKGSKISLTHMDSV
jgi:hypothetical protein